MSEMQIEDPLNIQDEDVIPERRNNTYKLTILMDRNTVLLVELKTALQISIGHYLINYTRQIRNAEGDVVASPVAPFVPKYQAVADYVNQSETLAELGILQIGEYRDKYTGHAAMLDAILKYNPILQVYSGRATRLSLSRTE